MRSQNESPEVVGATIGAEDLRSGEHIDSTAASPAPATAPKPSPQKRPARRRLGLEDLLAACRKFAPVPELRNISAEAREAAIAALKEHFFSRDPVVRRAAFAQTVLLLQLRPQVPLTRDGYADVRKLRRSASIRKEAH